jgi:hypothetical protein
MSSLVWLYLSHMPHLVNRSLIRCRRISPQRTRHSNGSRNYGRQTHRKLYRASFLFVGPLESLPICRCPTVPIRQRHLEDATLKSSRSLLSTTLSKVSTKWWGPSRNRVSRSSRCDIGSLAFSFPLTSRCAGTPPLGPISHATVHGASVQPARSRVL